jgi:hypothetical protein
LNHCHVCSEGRKRFPKRMNDEEVVDTHRRSLDSDEVLKEEDDGAL